MSAAILVAESRVFTFLAGKLAPGEAADADETAEAADEIADLAKQSDCTSDEQGG